MIDIARAQREAGTVRKAKRGELGQMAAVLARAFYDDPVFRWGVKDHSDRLRLFERGFALYLRKL